MSIRPFRDIKRRKTKKIKVGKVDIGGDAPISVQSMTNTLTTDVEATIKQINKLTEAGADIVRVSCPDKDSSLALKKISKRIEVPIVADIHFNYKLAIIAASSGANCLRINPGNIGSVDRVNEILKAEENAADTSKPNTCNDTGNTSCYKGNTLTVIGQVLDKSLLEITINGEYVTATSNITDDGSSTFITLPKSITHNASDTEDGVVDNVSIVEVGQISQAGIDYDYRFLGETWGSPRVFRMPNNGAGDRDIMDDEYVAVLPGGFGNGMPSIGSNVYIIDWITGKVKKEIKIKDSQDNDIVNSIPSSPVVITSEAAQEVFSGALVYINDLEGKITKINLTNMQGSYAYNQTSGAVTQTPPTGTANSVTLTQDIKLYDNYTFFDLEASTQTNNRYMYHSMEAGKGAKSKKFWLFGGTGDYMNLNDKQVNGARVKNVIFGVKDHLFPGFGSLNSTPDKLVQCVDMTDETNAQCADSGDRGWYKILKDRKKVTAEPTLANNIVYYPIYKPDSTTLGCGEGDALICAVDADFD
mgnify:CR=1 FL=1